LFDAIKGQCIEKDALISRETAKQLFLQRKDIIDNGEPDAVTNKSIVDQLYKTSLEIMQSLEDPFLEEKATEIAYNGWIMAKEIEIKEYIVKNRGEESYSKIVAECDKISERYEKTRPCSTSNVVFSPFDRRLRVKIDQQVMRSTITELDKYLCGGFQKSTLCGFLTTTGGGKSTLLFTLAGNMLRQGYNVAFVNLEMNDYEVNARVISATLQDDPYTDILYNLTDDAYMEGLERKWDERIKGVYTLISSTSNDDPYQKYDAKWLQNVLLSTENRISRSRGTEFHFDIVVIDYMFLMKPIAFGNKNERNDQTFQRLTQDVHKMCQVNNWCGITVFQTNRSGEENQEMGKALGFANFGDSYASNRDIDYQFSFRRSKEKGGIILDCLKSRPYDGEWEPFTLRYETKWMCYVDEPIRTTPEEMGYKNAWRDIVGLEYLQENLTQTDILKICEKKGCPISGKSVSQYLSDKGIKTPTRSKVNWEDINVDNLLRQKYSNGMQLGIDITGIKEFM